MQINLVSEKEFDSFAVFTVAVISLCSVSWQKWNQKRASSLTYLPLCDVQISHLSSNLAQAPQNNCWHDNWRGMKWVVTCHIHGRADKAGEHECVFHRESHLVKHRRAKTAFQSRHVLSMRRWGSCCSSCVFQASTRGSDVCSSTMADVTLKDRPLVTPGGGHRELIPRLSARAEGQRSTAVRIPQHVGAASGPSAERERGPDSQSMPRSDLLCQ